VIALGAGCYSPTINAGAPCETDCPGDLVCIDHVCREPGYTPGVDGGPRDAGPTDAPIDTPDGPPGDIDADGIDNASDNCPAKANVDQHDEDADALGDVCDPCPALAGNAVDGDGDGVGDACDPQPGVAKQRIAFFDPFTSDRPEWSNFTGASRVGESLRILATTSSSGARLNVGTGETRTYLGGTIPAISATTPHQLSINYGANAAGDVYHYVEFYDGSGNGGTVGIVERNVNSYTDLMVSPYAGALPTGAWSMRVDESVAAQQMRLLATLGGTAHPLLTASTAAAPVHIAGTRIGFFVRSADIRLDYVLVIETLP
jgi:hypothetical protein